MPQEKDLKSQAYEFIRRKIIRCEYAPGQLLSEQKLVEELKTSRTPIREAIGKIEQEGFVRVMPKKGIIVSEISLNDVRQIYQVREEIEPFMIRIAAPNFAKEQLLEFQKLFGDGSGEVPRSYGFEQDTMMHRFFAEYCGNRFLTEMMNHVYDQNTRVVISSGQYLRLHDSRSEHLAVIDKLLEGKTEEASEAMRTHIVNSKKSIFDYFMK